MKTHLCLLQQAPDPGARLPSGLIGRTVAQLPLSRVSVAVCAYKALGIENIPSLLCFAAVCAFFYRECDVTESRFRLDGGKTG